MKYVKRNWNKITFFLIITFFSCVFSYMVFETNFLQSIIIGLILFIFIKLIFVYTSYNDLIMVVLFLDVKIDLLKILKDFEDKQDKAYLRWASGDAWFCLRSAIKEAEERLENSPWAYSNYDLNLQEIEERRKEREKRES